MSTGMTAVRWTVQDSNRAALTTPVGRGSNQPSGLLLSPRFPAARNVYQGRTNPILYEKGFGYVFVYRRSAARVRRAVNEQRQGIIVVVPCLLFYKIKFALCELGRPLYGGMGQSLRTQEKGQALTYRGVLSLAGVIYFAQFKQIGI